MSPSAPSVGRTGPAITPLSGSGAEVVDHARISADGRLALVRATRHPGGILPILQHGVGGYIERIALQPGLDAWVNEEGLLLGLPPNRVGAFVCMRLAGGTIPMLFVGSVLLTGANGPDTTSLTVTQQQQIIQAWLLAHHLDAPAGTTPQ